jgi:hypothetical protein
MRGADTSQDFKMGLISGGLGDSGSEGHEGQLCLICRAGLKKVEVCL